MPEIPDLEAYRHALRSRMEGETLLRVRLGSPFLLRSVEPPVSACEGRVVREVRRLGKKLVLALAGDYFLVLHLMIAGRLQWKVSGARVPAKVGLAAFDFPTGTLTLTEAGTKRRAALYAVAGEEALREHDRGGLEVQSATLEQFLAVLHSESHTLKRTLTDPRLFAGIGNAYSDEILHRARLSPLKLTGRVSDAEAARLYLAAREVLDSWTAALIAEAGDGFPGKVTAFREEMAVHGRFGRPCPDCGSPVQRIVYAENECNYCATCQNEGRILADRAFSRLLREDWPRTFEELEDRRERLQP
ncbi:MAG: Fpg/Nei family DNA glycosylase [Armatimonadota bacterium]